VQHYLQELNINSVEDPLFCSYERDLIFSGAQMINKVAVTLFHLSPLVPFFLGYKYTGLAMILLVVLAYAKTKKLTAELVEKKAKNAPPRDLQPLERTRDFWWKLTFLPKPEI
jgi:hypothetical protein